MNIGLDSHLISSSLSLIIAQRLVKRICPHCKTPYTPSGEMLDKFAAYIQKYNVNMFYKGQFALAESFSYALFQGFCAGLGFMLAMLLMSGIRERLELLDLPESLKGIPVAFIVASLMSLAFMGFAGFKF